MKLVVTFIIILFFSFIAFNQKKFDSIKIGEKKNYSPSKELSEITDVYIHKTTFYNQFVTNYVFEDSFFQLENGIIVFDGWSFYSHYLIFFDKEFNWIETQESFDCDVKSDEIYYQIMPTINEATKLNLNLKEDCPVYTKVIKKSKTWYEFSLGPQEGEEIQKIYFFNEKLKLVKTENVKK